MRSRADGPPSSTILQGGRPKAYRPLPAHARRAALAEGLAAYDRGEWFEAHEMLEPAWMGTDDLPERELYQGLIKLAAAHVHRQRGNALGMTKNLAGARTRLSAALAGGADDEGLDLPALVVAIDDRLGRLAALGEGNVEDVAVIDVPRRDRGSWRSTPGAPSG
jgi:predicted metal-dependent hydrolase